MGEVPGVTAVEESTPRETRTTTRPIARSGKSASFVLRATACLVLGRFRRAATGRTAGTGAVVVRTGPPAVPSRPARRLHPAYALLLAAALAGCAHSPRGVPIDRRPTPAPPPDPTDRHTPSAVARPTHAVVPARDRIVADTTATHAVLERCLRRTLLPDQEPIIASTRELLNRVRAELLVGRLEGAESAARQARQLSRSLRCF